MSDNKTTDQDEYAYGSDVVDGCECPATAAGLDTMHGAISKIAGRFDERVRDGFKGTPEGKGTVPTDEAREEWQAAIEEARQRGTDEEVKYGELVVERLWPESG